MWSPDPAWRRVLPAQRSDEWPSRGSAGTEGLGVRGSHRQTCSPEDQGDGEVKPLKNQRCGDQRAGWCGPAVHTHVCPSICALRISTRFPPAPTTQRFAQPSSPSLWEAPHSISKGPGSACPHCAGYIEIFT